MAKASFLIRRIRSIGYAARGALLLLKTEDSIKTQAIIAVLVTIAGFYFNISAYEWIMQILIIALLMGVEGMNTALEKLADYVQPEFDTKIGFLKDIAAGAVFFIAVAAVIVGCLIYIPKIL